MPSCKQCRQSFEVTPEDLAFYDKVSPVFNGKKEQIPAPTLCSDCRQQRRLSYRNERSLFHRKCDLTGKQIISMYPAGSSFRVYDYHEWHSDRWDPMEYGMEFRFTETFLEQFGRLRLSVPRMSFVREGEIVNSEYCNRVSYSKNNYLIFSSSFNEDCYYSTCVNDSRDCCDCLYVRKSELLYDCVDCFQCYRSSWLEKCTNCSDSYFLRNCVGCRHCLFCTNLVQKEYCIFNKQYSKEEYQKELAKTLLSRHSTVEALRKKFDDVSRSIAVKNYVGTANENVSGDYLDHCRNVRQSFDCSDVEDGAYVQSVVGCKDVMDYTFWGRNMELVYETHAAGLQGRLIRFCNECWEGNDDLLYCDSCQGSRHLFGCVGLRKKEYCIFNRQYTKEQYEALVPKIIAHMRKTGEWGEFTPVSFSPFGYNETSAIDYFPLSRSEIESRGWRWHESEETANKYLGPPVPFPDDVRDATDDVARQIHLCEVTKKPFKVIPQEVDFHRRTGMPLPRRCPEQRHRDRFTRRNPRRLWSRSCAKCTKAIETTYAPDRPEIVYCEACYLSTVY